MYLWCWDDLADKKKVVDFRSPVLLLDLGENREELRGSPETLLRESTVAKL
jgi:hypothetical protein